MKPQSCKAKGRRLQQFIVQELLKLYPHLTADDIRSTSMGANGEDVQLSQAARIVLPYSFEAKNQERLNVWSAIEQSRENAPSTTEPIVVLKKNASQPYVVISWNLFKKFLKNPAEDKSNAKEELLSIANQLQVLAATL